MMIRTLSYLGAAIAAIAAAGTLAGCAAAGGTADAATGQLEQRTITVDSVPAAEEGGLYVAQAQGFFAQQGLTVKIKSITGGEAGIPDLQTGRAQLVAGNYVSFILAQMAGKFGATPQTVAPVNMRIIAAGSEIQPGTEALYVMPNSKFQTVAELAKAHARIGLNTANDIGDVMMGALLAENGYQLERDQAGHTEGGFPRAADHAAGRAGRRGLAAAAARRDRRAAVRRACRSPTSTRGRCRTSRSPATSGPRSG